MRDRPPLIVRLKPGIISSICADLGVSRHRLARRMDIHEDTLHRAEVDNGPVSGRLIAELRVVSGRSFDELFDIIEGD